MRIAARKLKAIVGHEKIIGWKTILQMDWMSSEDTVDTGAANRNLQPLKIRCLGWCSPSLNRIYACLHYLTTQDLPLASDTEAEDHDVNNLGPTVTIYYRHRSQGSLEETDKRSPPVDSCRVKGPVWKSLRDHPEDFTIFDLPIADGELDPDDLAWLADIEDHDNEPNGAADEAD
ncbi:hypothetical protein OBBRIDRAFT_837705 [Obba rivulosa]|uniref:Uncharacterized protein n=1 Tax=Obba rivulosa TaxID=1052685 RepID=A0A8E2DGE5_9APHY|nr:hypothetical protein OBBRIDRAFT_837705 [Obba rivulosa]